MTKPASGSSPAVPPLPAWLFEKPEPSSEKPIIVQKYGGSSVADPDRLRQVAQRVSDTVRSGNRVVVVVSAMGKTTDQLIALARSVSQAPPRRELDMLMSSGERISMALLAMALSELGHDAISFTGSQSGILTNDRHSGARIIEIRPIRILDELDRDRVVIVAGFQGMSYKREVTTLGRGGSDTTAVALAAALGADCEIYSDVDGVYSADPRVVPDAKHLPALGYRQMQELADHGAKVLNAQAVEWAQRAGIVIFARKTHGSTKQTVIRADTDSPPERGRATAVTGTTNLVEIQSRHGTAILGVLSEHGVGLRYVAQSGELLDVALALDDLPDFARTLAALRQVDPELALRQDLGMVSIVGPGLGSDPSVLCKVIDGLRQAGLAPGRVTTSPLRISVWLSASAVEAATQLLHRLLC